MTPRPEHLALAVFGAVLHGCSLAGLADGTSTSASSASGPSTTTTAAGGMGGAGGCDPNGGGVTSHAIWSRSFGGSLDQQGVDVAVDRAGCATQGMCVALVGTVKGEIAFGDGPVGPDGGGADVFVAAFDRDGNTLWARRFGGAGDDAPTGVAFDHAGDVLVTGSYPNKIVFDGMTLETKGKADIFVVKLARADGKTTWAKTFGGTGTDLPLAIAASATGALVAGTHDAGINFGTGFLPSNGKTDLFALALDDNGGTTWSNSYGNSEQDYARGVAATPDGNIVLAGAFQLSLDLGGPTPLTSQGGYDVFTTKLAPATPAYVWGVGYGNGAYPQTAHSVAVDPTGDVVVAGEFVGTLGAAFPMVKMSPIQADAFVVKMRGDDGTPMWGMSMGDASEQTNPQIANAIAVDTEGNPVVVGNFYVAIGIDGVTLDSAGVNDIFVTKLSKDDGQAIWRRSYGNTNDQSATAVAVDDDGYVYVTGWFRDPLDFGDCPIPNGGDSDAFLVKLDK